ncbi:MAG: xanthine dehydrogenase family protein molybdopterin-binding subunit [Chloroflexi bacterium]|nr:xanthine dehydrogenase family protein molybdopterin-binding subunit [Chloroflexota bacterium]
MTQLAPGGARVVGQGIPKADARLKASGTARYAADIRPDGRAVLCGRILRSGVSHATIVSIDAGKAAALSGVFAVVTGKDVAPARIGRFLQDRTVLARDKVRCIGEPVAAVAAIDEATAAEALSLIDVEYWPLPSVLTPDLALAPGAPLIHEDLANYQDILPTRRYANVRNLVVTERGEVEAAFAKADVVVEGVFTTQPVHQGFIEPKACVAAVDENGRVTVWPSNKNPFLARTMIGRGLGLPLSKVRVIAPTVGADFGGKGAPTIEPICALLAIKAGRPVRIALGMQEELATNFTRHPAVIKLKVAADAAGRLLGVEGEMTLNCGAYCDGFCGQAFKSYDLQGPYNVPAVRLRGLSVMTNNAPAGHVRAPGGPQASFAIESLMDELARHLNQDPIEIRRINAIKSGDPALGPSGVMGANGLAETIEKVAEYVSRNMSGKRTYQGVGVACGAWHASPAAEVAPYKCVLKLNEDGSAVLLTGTPDNGAGQHQVLAQVVAEILSLEPGEVTVFGGDTELTPLDAGPGASRGTVRVAHAARFAAEDARHQLLLLAAAKLEANPEDLELVYRQARVKGTPERAVSLAELARLALTSPEGQILGTGSRERAAWVAAEKEHALVADEAQFCTHAAQVEVDPETGQVTVLKYVVAQDVGFALNPLSAAGQVEGSVVHGLGYALTEELVVEGGQVVNPSLVDYHLPVACSAPAVEAILVEQPSPAGPFGARGVGEASIAPVPAAIANAIRDAVGVRIWDLPITPEKVRHAIREIRCE